MSKLWIVAVAVVLMATACGGGGTGTESVATGPPAAETDAPAPTTDAPAPTTGAETPPSAEEPSEAAPQSASVDIVDLDFDLAEVEIAVGGTITWINTGDLAHTVTSRSAGFDSGSMEPGDDFTFTPEEAGTITYSCQFHSSMQGEIVVTA